MRSLKAHLEQAAVGQRVADAARAV
jgi:hypothetical protein